MSHLKDGPRWKLLFITVVLVSIFSVTVSDTDGFQHLPQLNDSLKKLFLQIVVLSFSFFLLAFVLPSILMVIAEIPGKFKKFKKCDLCQQPAYDILSGSSNKDEKMGIFCRRHLIERYSQQFIKTSLNFVMVEFQPRATRYTGAVYGYYPVSQLQKYFFKKDERQIVEQLLATILEKKCRSCDKKAQVLFISKEAAPWEKYNCYPFYEYADKGEYLCLEHTLKRILPSIQNNPKHFDDGGGLWLPYLENGYQVTTEL
ncbi:hypothetical protein HYU95_03400 [Candidatus Daviesbacteria bacterium]|nr:hypothetical protein [Candidatus Daviesbacteria bacterium]